MWPGAAEGRRRREAPARVADGGRRPAPRPSLDVAAAARGCPAVARGIGRRVVARYAGPGLGALRRRAEAGLAEVGAGGSVLELVDRRRAMEFALTGALALGAAAYAGLLFHERRTSRRPFPAKRLIPSVSP